MGGGVSLVALAACGGSDDNDDDATTGSSVGATEVRPFSEIQGSAIVFEADPSNLERGIFRVETTEPMICAIVWGETETLGRFNNSLAMNGTGIINHDVFLPEVVPGDMYFFRIQGSTADGTLYQSDLDTFTIPVIETGGGDDTAEFGENLALGATVAEVSSEFNASFAAANAIDDSGTTEWSSAGDGDDAFITLDLGAEREIAAVQYITRSMLDGSAIAETFTVTIDDASFGPFPAGTPVEPNTAAVQAVGRTVRFDVETSTGGNIGAVQVRVLAP
ncbi:hypothetical protein BH23ACT3_BH23ACT3_06770 [soil metagenome]